MDVVRVSDGNGSHIEPAWDEKWDQATKLRWQAAVTALDTGLEISLQEIRPGMWLVGAHPSVEDAFEAWTAHAALAPDEVRAYLVGALAGARLARGQGAP